MIMYMLQIIHVDHLQCFHGFQSERLSLMMYMSSMAGPFNLQSFSIMLILCEFWCFRMSPLWYGTKAPLVHIETETGMKVKTQLKGVIVISLIYNKLKIMLCYGVFILIDCLLYDHCKSHIMYIGLGFE